jgi:hypothetical protein
MFPFLPIGFLSYVYPISYDDIGELEAVKKSGHHRVVLLFVYMDPAGRKETKS